MNTQNSLPPIKIVDVGPASRGVVPVPIDHNERAAKIQFAPNNEGLNFHRLWVNASLGAEPSRQTLK